MGRIAKKRAHRLHNFFVNSARALLHFLALRVAQAFAKSLNRRFDLLCRTKLFPFHFALLPHDVSDVARLAVSIDVVNTRIKRAISGELDQSCIRRDRRLHRGEYDRLRLRAEFGAPPADLGFEFFFLFFKRRDPSAEIVHLRLSRSIKFELCQLRRRCVEFV